MNRLQAVPLDDRLRDSSLPVLVDFTADWCPPCRAIAPVLDAIAAERIGSLDVVRLDVDSHPDTGDQHAIRTLPTLALFVDGVERTRVVGAHPKRHLDQWLDHWLAGADSDEQ